MFTISLSIACLISLIAFIAGIWVGHYAPPQKPDIHVHLPEGATLPELPEGAPLAGSDNQRVALYWRVYKEALAYGRSYPEDHAREAVEAVFDQA